MRVISDILGKRKEQGFIEKLVKDLKEMDVLTREISELKTRAGLLKPQVIGGKGKDFDYFVSIEEELGNLKEMYESYPLFSRAVYKITH